MSLRYLYGPAPGNFASDYLPVSCACLDCIPFGRGDLETAKSWEQFLRFFPEGWQPDFIALELRYQALPPWLLQAPVPLVGLAGDPQLLWQGYRHLLPALDLVLTDLPSARRLQLHGISQVLPAILYGLPRSFLLAPSDEARDIDILCVSNHHPAVQRARLPWLGRVAQMAGRFKVLLATGVWGEDYRAYLRRSRIVFNHSIRGEWNHRAGEAVAAGALLFVERDNIETAALLQDGKECVCYSEGNLEALLEQYLTHEDQRRALAEAAHARREELTFESFWRQAMSVIEAEIESLRARARERKLPGEIPDLLARTWRAISAGGDPALYEDLLAAHSRQPHSAELPNALGLAIALKAMTSGRVTADAARQAAGHFTQALQRDPHHLLALLNLAEALVGIGQNEAAITTARQLLRGLLRSSGDDASLLEAPRFPPGFDLFSVEWQHAAWDHPGDRRAEAAAKRTLLRWRAHFLLAELTGNAAHHHDAVLARPDLPLSRAALGCALARGGSVDLAVPHLFHAVAGNPFDADAARALYQSLIDTNQDEEADLLSRSRHLLCRAAPGLVLPEGYFRDGKTHGPTVRHLSPQVFAARYGRLDTTRALLGFTSPQDTQAILTLLAHLRPRRILEIGTSVGQMTANLTEWSPDDATVFSLGMASEPTDRAALGRFADHFGKAMKVHFLTADSLKYDFNRLAPLDFALIDGVHDQEHVLSDTRKVYDALRPGGCIIWQHYGSAAGGVEVRQGVEQAALPEPVQHVEGTEVAFLVKQETGIRSQESGIRGQESGVRGQESGVSQKSSSLTPDSCLLTPAVSVSWEGSFTELHSLALVNQALCRRLLTRGVDLNLSVTEFQGPFRIPRLPLPPELAGRVQARPRADVHVRHSWPPRFDRPASGKLVIMQPWEFGSLPAAWLEPLQKQVDEVWVPSSFVRDTFVASGVPAGKVFVIPNGINPEEFRPGLPPFPLKTTKRWKFLFVGGTLWRKGIDVLLTAYGRAFMATDDVCLVIKDMGKGSFYKDQTAEEMIARFRATPRTPEIEYLDGALSAEEQAGLYAACDCLVHPYRGEGFGMPIAEAMACGLPVIVTNAGAALDFCSEERAYLLPCRITPLPEKRVGDLETVDSPFVAEPDSDALAALLRHVFNHPDQARARGAAARAYVTAQLTWAHAADRVVQRLLALCPQGALQARPVRTMKTSLCLIVKNEERNLPDCLTSAAGIFDEIIVVDTGSTDRTKEIARSFGARVFDFPWINSFSAARNECLRHATGDWIFWLDGDDRLDPANRAKLSQLLDGLTDENVAYSLKCLCLPEPGASWTQVDHIRLFRNYPQLRWQYRVHEQILPAIRRLGGQVHFADVVIHHVGYADPALRGRKLQRDLMHLELDLADHPEDAFILFNLGSIYQELGRHEEALVYLRKSLERSDPSDSIVRKLFGLIVGSLRLLGRTRDALGVCREGLQAVPDDAELLYRQGRLERELGNLPAAEASYRQLLGTKPDPHFASIDPDLRGWRGRHELAGVLRQEGKHIDALPLAREVTREQPGWIPGWLQLGQLGLDTGNLALTEEAAQTLAQLSGGAIEAHSLRLQALLARGEFVAARTGAEKLVAEKPGELRPRQLLAQVLLAAEDLPAAEEALRQVLRLDPCDQQAHGVLASLLRRRMRSENDVFSALGDLNAWVLGEHFQAACLGPSEVHEHLSTLRDLARECKSVTEIGSPSAATTLAFLMGEPRRLVCLDPARRRDEEVLKALAGAAELIFQVANPAEAQPQETDLLFVGLGPGLELKDGFLERHAARARKLVVVHGTTDGNGRSQAVEALLAGGQFHLRQRHENNHGLTVLERVASAGQA
jgi:glycosyltransferase involved in cell wall biosynthesis/cytochrome c-type biogenesis protein CcmH/NrfG